MLPRPTRSDPPARTDQKNTLKVKLMIPDFEGNEKRANGDQNERVRKEGKVKLWRTACTSGQRKKLTSVFDLNCGYIFQTTEAHPEKSLRTRIVESNFQVSLIEQTL